MNRQNYTADPERTEAMRKMIQDSCDPVVKPWREPSTAESAKLQADFEKGYAALLSRHSAGEEGS